ncbi:MAG TPA: DMT family transporter [Chloroflexia bacterium]|nr:DMT family transporter [Chloroflexia bacterium]
MDTPITAPLDPTPVQGWRDPGVLWLLASAAGFGAMAIFAKLAYAGGLTLATLLATRFGLAAILMWVLVLSRRGYRRLPGRTLLGLLAMGGIGYVGQSFAFFTALQTVSAATTALLLYTYPALVTLLAWLVFRHPLTRASMGALALASLGCILVLGGPDALPGQVADPVGLGWALGAAVVYALYIIAGTHVTAGVPPLLAGTYIITAAAVVYGGAGLAGNTLDFAVSPGGWVAVVAIAVICTVLPIAGFVAGLARLGPGRASILSTVEPVITIALAALVLGESVHPLQLIGGTLILSAALVVSRGGVTGPDPERQATASSTAEPVLLTRPNALRPVQRLTPPQATPILRA